MVKFIKNKFLFKEMIFLNKILFKLINGVFNRINVCYWS